MNENWYRDGKQQMDIVQANGQPFLYKTMPSYWNLHSNHHPNPLNEFIIIEQGSELNVIGRMMGM